MHSSEPGEEGVPGTWGMSGWVLSDAQESSGDTRMKGVPGRGDAGKPGAVLGPSRGDLGATEGCRQLRGALRAPLRKNCPGGSGQSREGEPAQPGPPVPPCFTQPWSPSTSSTCCSTNPASPARSRPAACKATWKPGASAFQPDEHVGSPHAAVLPAVYLLPLLLPMPGRTANPHRAGTRGPR